MTPLTFTAALWHNLLWLCQPEIRDAIIYVMIMAVGVGLALLFIDACEAVSEEYCSL